MASPVPAPSRRALVLIGALLLAPLVASCGEETPDGFSDQVRESFLEQCVGGNDPSDASDDAPSAGELRDECECMYESLSSTLEFDEFRELDTEVRADQNQLPDQVNDLLVRCVITA